MRSSFSLLNLMLLLVLWIQKDMAKKRKGRVEKEDKACKQQERRLRRNEE